MISQCSPIPIAANSCSVRNRNDVPVCNATTRTWPVIVQLVCQFRICWVVVEVVKFLVLNAMGITTGRYAQLVVRIRATASGTTFKASFVDLSHESVSMRSPNGRFLRHRPERSERCLNYGNCTKASERCQRTKVCPKGLSVKTMLSVR